MLENIICLIFLQIVPVVVNGEGVGVAVVGIVSENDYQPLIVHLRNHYNVNYFGNLWIGTPKYGEERQKFSILFDTGSVDFIVVNSGHKKICKNDDERRKNHCVIAKRSEYDKSKSETYNMVAGTFTSRYLDTTELSGHIANEYIEIGEGTSKIRVKVRIGLADVVENEVSSNSGVFGLGFGIGSNFEPNILTALESIFTQTDIPPQIGFYVIKDENEEINGYYGGEIYFGGYNPHFVDSEFMAPVPVVRTDELAYAWDMAIRSIKVGDNEIVLEGHDLDGDGLPGTMAVPDTGSSTLVISERIFNKMIPYLFPGKTNRYVFTDPKFLCGLLPTNLPDITFVVNDHVSFTLGPENYIRTSEDGMVCNVAILGSKCNRLIFGNTFLQKYYTVFDYQKQVMMFALAKQAPVNPHRRQPGVYGREKMSTYSDREIAKIKHDLKLGIVRLNIRFLFQ